MKSRKFVSVFILLYFVFSDQFSSLQARNRIELASESSFRRPHEALCGDTKTFNTDNHSVFQYIFRSPGARLMVNSWLHYSAVGAGKPEHIRAISELSNYMNELMIKSEDLKYSDSDIYGMLRKWVVTKNVQLKNKNLSSLDSVFNGRDPANPDSDSQIYFGLNKNEINRVERRADDILSVLGLYGVKPFSIRNFLDFGGGSGHPAEALASKLNLRSDSTGQFKTAYSVDVSDYKPVISKRVQMVSYKENKKGHRNFTIDIPDRSLDLVNINMVLHHIPEEDLTEYIQLIRTKLSPNGVLLIRDSDIQNEDQHFFNILADNMFYRVFSDLNDVPLPLQYRSKQTWITVFRKLGFRPLEYHSAMQIKGIFKDQGTVKFDSERMNPFLPFNMVFKLSQ